MSIYMKLMIINSCAMKHVKMYVENQTPIPNNLIRFD